jgi:hypothetical protein
MEAISISSLFKLILVVSPVTVALLLWWLQEKHRRRNDLPEHEHLANTCPRCGAQMMWKDSHFICSNKGSCPLAEE